MNKSPLLIIMTVLLAINMALTSALFFKIDGVMNSLGNLSSEKPLVPLPEELTKKEIVRIYESFEDSYNTRDPEVFFSALCDYSKARMDKADFQEQYKKLLDYFGLINGGTYSHFEYQGSEGNLKAYTLYFVLDLGTDSKFGPKGNLKLGVMYDGKEFGILSGYVTAGEMM